MGMLDNVLGVLQRQADSTPHRQAERQKAESELKKEQAASYDAQDASNDIDTGLGMAGAGVLPRRQMVIQAQPAGQAPLNARAKADAAAMAQLNARMDAQAAEGERVLRAQAALRDPQTRAALLSVLPVDHAYASSVGVLKRR